MSNLDRLNRQIKQATYAEDEEAVKLFEQERERILLEETDWIPSVLARAKKANDFETVNFLQQQLDDAPKPPETKYENTYENTYKLPDAPKTIYEEKEE